MRICVTSSGSSLDSLMDRRFARCPYFVFADTRSGNHEVVLNEAIFAGSGAGVSAGQLMEEKAVDAVVTGNLGPESLAFLNRAGIAVYRGEKASVRENISLFSEGRLQPMEGPCARHEKEAREGPCTG